MVTTETAKDRYDFLAHQIGGLAVSLMTRTVAMDPDAANRYGYQVQAFLDMADCALEDAQARATAAAGVIEVARAVRDAWLFGSWDIEELAALHDAIEAYDVGAFQRTNAENGG